MSFFKVIIILFSVCFFTFIYLLNNFIESFPAKKSYEIEYDGVVVLTGGKGRLKAGRQALLAKKNTKLLITGVGKNTSVEELGFFTETIKKRIHIDRLAKSTFQNAREIKIWAKENEFNNILLITSAYHIPRSKLVINHEFPELNIIPFPVYTENVKLEEWWIWPGTTKLLINEFFKYIFANLHIFVFKYLV